MSQDTLIPIGRFTKPHGLRGEVVFLPYVYDVTLLPDLSQCSVTLQRASAPPRECTILDLRMAHKQVLVRVVGYTTVNAAETLRDYEVLIPRRWFPPLPVGEYYWFEIEGLMVYASDGQVLGMIAEIIYTGSNDVYVVRGGSREILIPALKDVVQTIDLAQGAMHLCPMDGLLDT
jgi:16S rRNA processing protein RimM